VNVEPGGATNTHVADVVTVTVHSDACADGTAEVELVTSIRGKCLLGIPAGRDAMHLVIAGLTGFVITVAVDRVGGSASGGEAGEDSEHDTLVTALHFFYRLHFENSAEIQ
jgi:hypothetical protein